MSCDRLFVCHDCGHIFTSPTNDFNMSVDPCSEDAECPRCRSDNFDEAVQCSECEDYFDDEDLNSGFCKSCLTKLATEHAAEFVMRDPSIRSDFAWWLRDKLRHEGR